MPIERVDNRYRVSGPVTMGTARVTLEEGLKLFAEPVSEVDFSDVTEVDSSAVSIMLEWRRDAQRRNRQVQYLNLPENLKSLASVYGVLDVIEDRRRGAR